VFNSQHRQEILLFSTMSRMALDPTQPTIQWILGYFPQGYSRWAVQLTTHLHPVLRLRMSGAKPHSPYTLPWYGKRQ